MAIKPTSNKEPILMELTQASRQWASRPNDERFVSLDDMLSHFRAVRGQSREVVAPSKRLQVIPQDDHRGLMLTGPNGHPYAPTNWSFGQLAALAEAPAGYLRKLPAELAADCINVGLQVLRQQEDIGCLLYRGDGTPELRAATGPKYGRIWNSDVVSGLVDRFGDGIHGQFRVPGEFGKAVTVDKSNTTLYASDRDMFVFLADEERRISIPNRRHGEPGELARGFFVWNSEVGSSTFGIATFLFDYVCMNRIVWGATDFQELKIRHTGGAPDRFFREVAPALQTYANSSTTGVQAAIEDARKVNLGDDLDAFLATRFNKSQISSMKAAHLLEEERPIETRWDVVVAATAVARGIEHQDARVDLERAAGKLLTIA
jgi:hypothetical protein